MSTSTSRFKAPTRDSVTTINEDGSHYVVHTADVSGRFTSLRRLVGWVLLTVYAVLPWIQINGHPAVFLDAGRQRFHLFGFTLAAQDLWLLFFMVTGVGFGLFFVTALLGRIWCGWACPQTVFLDFIIRRIERFIEGDAMARRALDAAPWSAAKAVRRVVKYALFFFMALAIAHMFAAYFVSLPALYKAMLHAPAENWTLFLVVFGMTVLLFIDFAWFREQFCIILCPYGRFQSALIDDHSIVIGYDEKRGEPRGKASDSSNGDCIDCRRCVQVCPTGIDIRQGLQMECIGCSNCIDACDEIMVKLDRPKGLVRYDSYVGLGGGCTKWVRPRTVIYAILMAIGACVMTYAFSTVQPATLVVTRMTGAPYYFNEGILRNQFFVRVINKEATPQTYRLEVRSTGQQVGSAGVGEEFSLDGNQEVQRPIVLTVPLDSFKAPFPVRVILTDSQGREATSRETSFLGPDPDTL